VSFWLIVYLFVDDKLSPFTHWTSPEDKTLGDIFATPCSLHPVSAVYMALPQLIQLLFCILDQMRRRSQRKQESSSESESDSDGAVSDSESNVSHKQSNSEGKETKRKSAESKDEKMTEDEDAFSARHDDFCAHCDDGGSLVLCSSCVHAWHFDCLKDCLADDSDSALTGPEELQDDWTCKSVGLHCQKRRKKPRKAQDEAVNW
jgi:hypothetical protein